MPKRTAKPDSRWDERPSGLMVPRTVGKTRRFIEKFGQAQCCCDAGTPFIGCGFCGNNDETASVTVTISGTVETSTGDVYTMDGSYELTTKTTGSPEVWSVEFSDTFPIPEDGGGPDVDATFEFGFACGVSSVNFGGWVRIGPAGAYYESTSFPYSSSSGDDCMVRFFSDYGSPVSMNKGNSYDNEPWVTEYFGSTASVQ